MLTGYYFAVGNVHIDNTRSRHEDTDYFTSSVTVGDRSLKHYQFMGDVNNGDHDISAIIGPVPIEDTGVKVSFSYQVVNAGHSDPSAIQKGLSDAADSIAKKLWDKGLAGDLWSAAGAGAIELVTKILLPAFTANCDGLVVLDQISRTGAQLLTKTKVGWSEARHYPGTDSSTGCGGNSDYTVDFNIYRSHWTGWLPWLASKPTSLRPSRSSRVSFTCSSKAQTARYTSAGPPTRSIGKSGWRCPVKVAQKSVWQSRILNHDCGSSPKGKRTTSST